MPSPKRQPDIRELLSLAASELDRSIHRPNILSYGQKDYPEQIAFHKSAKRGRYVAGGNRGGKTSAEVVEAIWWASDTHPWLERPESWGSGPLQLRFVVVDIAKGVEQIILPEMKRWIPASYLIDGSWSKSWDSQNLILTLDNGSTIDFVTWGMDMMKLGGVPRHGIFFDEEPPQHIFNECMMRLVDYNGFWVIAGTPVNGMTWTFDLLWEPNVNNPDGPVSCHELSMEKNPYVQATKEDRDFYFMGADEQEREIREQGHFVARSGLVIPSMSQDPLAYVIDAARMPLPPRDWTWYSSVDFGFNNPTAWLWHAVGPQGQIVTFAEHYAKGMTVAEHSAIVKAREEAFGRAPDIRVGDPAGKQHYGTTGTSYVSEYAVRGLYVDVESVPRDVMIGVEKMQQYFQIRPQSPWGENRPMWVISSNCVNFLREMKKLRWATYSSDKTAYDMNKQETVHKKDDHTFDSARYFATLMPDLILGMDATGGRLTEPVTLSYQELLAKMSNDPDVVEVDDQMAEELDWETMISSGDLYQGGLIA